MHTNPHTHKRNRCVAFSQLSAKSNRMLNIFEGGFTGKCRLCRLMPAKSENKSLYVVVFDQICFVSCLHLSLARLLALWQRINERAHTFYCNPDFSFIRRFMLNQDKFVVRCTVYEYIFCFQSIYRYLIHNVVCLQNSDGSSRN